MKKNKISWIKFYFQDEQTLNNSLSLLQRGAYQSLRVLYLNDTLPSDQNQLYALCFAFSENEKKAVDFVYKKYFFDIKNNKLFEQKKEAEEKYRKLSKAGKSPKTHKNKTGSYDKSNDLSYDKSNDSSHDKSNDTSYVDDLELELELELELQRKLKVVEEKKRKKKKENDLKNTEKKRIINKRIKDKTSGRPKSNGNSNGHLNYFTTKGIDVLEAIHSMLKDKHSDEFYKQKIKKLGADRFYALLTEFVLSNNKNDIRNISAYFVRSLQEYK